MDPETNRLLLGGLLTVAGILVGAGLNWFANRSNANRQIQGQRAIARDNALREFRLEEVKPFLELARQRYVWMVEFEEDELTRAEGREPRKREWRAAGHGWQALLVTIPDQRLVKAVRDFDKLYSDASDAIYHEWGLQDQGARPTMTATQAWEQLEAAVKEVHEAARHYVFGP